MAPRGRCDATGKAKYRFHEARRKAKAARRREDEIVQEYRCSDCGWWHFGHSARPFHR